MTLPKDYVLDAEIQAKGLDWMTAEIKRLRAALEEIEKATHAKDAELAMWVIRSKAIQALAGGEK